MQNKILQSFIWAEVKVSSDAINLALQRVGKFNCQNKHLFEETHMFYTNEENKWFQFVDHLAFVAPFK